jgi:hypothetical protein
MTRRTKPKQEQQATGSEQMARQAIAEKARRRLNSLLLESVDVLEKELKGPDALKAAAQILTLGLQSSPPQSKPQDLSGFFEELLRAIADPTERATAEKAPRRRERKTK